MTPNKLLSCLGLCIHVCTQTESIQLTNKNQVDAIASGQLCCLLPKIDTTLAMHNNNIITHIILICVLRWNQKRGRVSRLCVVSFPAPILSIWERDYTLCSNFNVNPLYTRFVFRMAVESQSQAPLRYMAVPEKIELGGGGARDPPGGGGRYRPMKVLLELEDITGVIVWSASPSICPPGHYSPMNNVPRTLFSGE